MPWRQPDALEVYRHGQVPDGLLGGLGVAVAGVHDPGIVEQHVESTERLLGGCNGGGHVGLDRYVGCQGNGLAASAGSLVHDVL